MAVAQTRIPITLLTGFLGSGKTTVLNHILRPNFWERLLRVPPLTAVIVNEFGSVGLDQQLIGEATTQQPTALLSGGCVCCEMQDSLAATLKSLWADRQAGTLPPYERIVIETTGIADPTRILESVLTSPWVTDKHYIDGVVTTVDAVFGQQQLAAHFEAMRQVASADCVLLTKTDLIDATALAEIQAALNHLNPHAQIVPVVHGHVSAEHIFNLRAHHLQQAEQTRTWLQVHALKPVIPANAAHLRRIQSFSVVFDTPLEWQQVAAAIETLVGLCHQHLLRMKAILNVKEHNGPVVVHAVQHVVYPTVELPNWVDNDKRSRFVFITADIEAEFVKNILTSFTQHIQADAIASTLNQAKIRRDSQ